MRLNATLLTIALLSLSAALAVAQQSPINPLGIVPTETSGMIGIAAGQTARLNALHPGVPAPLATAARCPVTVSFLDDQGNVLQSSQIIVDPGKSLPVDYVMSAPGRLQIRALIAFTQSTPVANPAGPAVAVPFVCPLIPTLEIFDTSTTKTQSVLSDFHFVSYGFLPGLLGGSLSPR